MGMEVNLMTPAGLFWAMLPEIVLTGWALVLMLVAGWRHSGEEDQRFAGQLALATLVSALLALWVALGEGRPTGRSCAHGCLGRLSLRLINHLLDWCDPHRHALARLCGP